MTPDRLLLRNGCVIDTEPEPTAYPGHDVLVENGRIAAVGPGLPADGAEVIEAADRIVLPGFVDTHRHTWQAVLRSYAVDDDLGRYLTRVRRGLSPHFRPEDVYAGNLVGALECLDAGITTLQDFSHIQHTHDHTEASVSALRDAGLRAVFGYGYPTFDDTSRRPADVRRLREERFGSDDALVTMALAPLGPSYAPMGTVQDDWLLAADLGLRIAVHVGRGPVAERPVEALRAHGLLRAGTTYVHGNSLDDSELRLIAESGGSVSIAPEVEARMGHGGPMIDRLRAAGIVTGLGVDVVTTVAGDMFSLMRAALLTSRFRVVDGPGAGGSADRVPQCTAADVLRMATLDGAAALGLADRIGSLSPGKQADIVLLRTDTVNLVGAAHDPVGAVVTAAHPGNVDTVLVAGRVVKRDGRLLHADLGRAVEAARSSAERLAALAPNDP